MISIDITPIDNGNKTNISLGCLEFNTNLPISVEMNNGIQKIKNIISSRMSMSETFSLEGKRIIPSNDAPKAITNPVKNTSRKVILN